MNKFPISIASYSFHGMLGKGQTSVFTYLEDTKFRYGVDYADIWNGYLPVLEEDLLKKVRASLDEKGMILANFCVDGVHVWDDDDERRASNKKGALEHIKAAEIMGARTIRIDMGSLEENVPDEKMDYIIKTYREYAHICGELGMRIGTENHWGSSRYPHNLEAVYKGVDNPAYGVLFHFGNFVDGQVEKGLETVLPMAMHTHVHADSVPYAKEYIRRLANIGYKGTFSIEHHSGQHEYQRVAWQLSTVRALITELIEEGTENPAAPDYISQRYGLYAKQQGLRDTNPLIQDVVDKM